MTEQERIKQDTKRKDGAWAWFNEKYGEKLFPELFRYFYAIDEYAQHYHEKMMKENENEYFRENLSCLFGQEPTWEILGKTKNEEPNPRYCNNYPVDEEQTVESVTLSIRKVLNEQIDGVIKDLMSIPENIELKGITSHSKGLIEKPKPIKGEWNYERLKLVKQNKSLKKKLKKLKKELDKKDKLYDNFIKNIYFEAESDLYNFKDKILRMKSCCRNTKGKLPASIHSLLENIEKNITKSRKG